MALTFLAAMRPLSLYVALSIAHVCLAQELRFQHVTTDQGLSDNAITCLLQDRDGFLWIGTERGLNRFDGQRVDPVAGSEHAIAGITEDSRGSLWVATKDHGLLQVDRERRKAKPYRHVEGDPKSLANDQLTVVFDLNDTTLLLGSREHTLIFMDKRTQAFSYWADSTSLEPSRALPRPTGLAGWCHTITALDDHTLWIGTLNKHQSFLVDRANLKITTHLVIRRPGSETQTCAVRLGDTLYTGGWQQGIDAVPFTMGNLNGRPLITQPRVIPAADEVLSLVARPDGTLLAGTRGSGLLVYDPRTGGTTTVHHRRSETSSIPSDRVRCMLMDRSGTLWVGTVNGLAYHAPQVWRIRTTPLLSGGEEEEIELMFHRLEAEGPQGVRVFTSDGFYRQDRPDGPVTQVPLKWDDIDLQPTFMLKQGSGALIGTEYGFVKQSSLDDGRYTGVDMNDGYAFTFHPGDMYQVRYIATDTMAGRPIMVVGTLGYGVHVIDARTMTILGCGMPPAAQTVKARSLVSDMVRDEKGTYWIASADGLYKWRRTDPLTNGAGERERPVSHTGIIGSGKAFADLVLEGGMLWAVTREGDLIRVEGDSLQHVQTPWRINGAHGLCADRQGRLWLSSDDGLIRADPRDGGFIRVPVNDGSSHRKLTRAIGTLSDGSIAFAANNTLFRFDPAMFDSLPALPTPYLSSTSTAGEAVVVNQGRITLSYTASVIDIGISALAFGFPKALAFEYRLDGVEREWRTTTATAPVRYAGVPVGEHRLLVRVHDPYGRTGPEHVLLVLRVNGPFWQQWWFYALAAVIASLGVYAWSRYRLAQALKLQTVRDRIASDLHDEVGSSLSSITIGSKLAAQLSTSESAQVKEILARIGETSSESLRSISDIVWAIDPKNDQGEALVKRMRRIANELLESKGIEVAFTVTGGVEELKLPMNARKEIVLIYKEAVHNASKYSNATQVQVELSVKQSNLMVRLHDNGKGFEPALHPDGHGLGSMKRRAHALGAAFELQSANGSGTTVKLKVDLTGMRD